MTQESRPSRSRKPTAFRRAARSPQKARTAAACSGPGFTVTTRKIAARVSVAVTGCGVVADTLGSLVTRSASRDVKRESVGLQTTRRGCGAAVGGFVRTSRAGHGRVTWPPLCDGIHRDRTGFRFIGLTCCPCFDFRPQGFLDAVLIDTRRSVGLRFARAGTISGCHIGGRSTAMIASIDIGSLFGPPAHFNRPGAQGWNTYSSSKSTVERQISIAVGLVGCTNATLHYWARPASLGTSATLGHGLNQNAPEMRWAVLEKLAGASVMEWWPANEARSALREVVQIGRLIGITANAQQQDWWTMSLDPIDDLPIDQDTASSPRQPDSHASIHQRCCRSGTTPRGIW